MMGLQATSNTNKRKYELSECQDGDVPSKTSRWSNGPSITSTGVHSTPIIQQQQQPQIKLSPPHDNTPVIQQSPIENSIAKLEAVAIPGETWGSPEPIVDSIQRLQAVVVPGERWGSERSTLATTLLATDELDDDDDDFEEDFDEDDTAIPNYSPMRYPCSPPRGYIPSLHPKHFSYYKESYPQSNCAKTTYFQRQGPPQYGAWSHYYNPPETTNPQQTIRCAENGKSYLELGCSSYSSNNMNNMRNQKRCCDGKNNWCNTKQCYRERRHKIMNLSMFKLSRFRQISEQSLYRSVLICNTLKLIEKEMEIESKEINLQSSTCSPHNTATTTVTTTTTPPSSINNISNSSSNYCVRENLALSNNGESNNQTSVAQQDAFSYGRPVTPSPTFSDTSQQQLQQQQQQPIQSPPSSPINNSTPSYELPYVNPLRNSGSGRVTPFPMFSHPDTDSGYGDEDCTRPINWGSVLNLSSQSALDPLNNNDLFSSCTTTSSLTSSSSYWDYNIFEITDFGLEPDLIELQPSWKLTPLSADDILKSVPPPMEPSKIMHDNEIDSFTHIMVGS